MTTLYRKYRPQTFADLVGQEYIVQTITNEIVMNKIAHAYLFSGPRGTGKTTLARLLAKAVNCQNRAEDSFEPCDECSSCKEITQNRNIDVIEIDAASQTGVDNVRENIIENAIFKPNKSKYKLFIIDEVHMLSMNAFNALLKTLEEPPAHCIFILATTELHKLPATVISRCQRFVFKKIPSELMKKRLKKLCTEENIQVDDEVLEKIIIQSEGCERDAESLLGQLFSLQLKSITKTDVESFLPTVKKELVFAFMEQVLTRQTETALTTLQNYKKDGIQFEYFMRECIDFLHQLLLLKSEIKNTDLTFTYSKEEVKQITKLLASLELSYLVTLIDRALIRMKEIKTAPIPELPLELWVIENNLPLNLPNTFSDILSKEVKEKNKSFEKKTEEEIEEKKEASLPSFTQTIKTAISHITHHESSAQPIPLEQIKQRWEEVITAIGTQSPSLTFIMRMCTVEEINEKGIHLTVPYLLHKEKLTEMKNKKIIEDSLEKIFNQKLNFFCTIHTNLSVAETNLSELAQEFGGEIIS